MEDVIKEVQTRDGGQSTCFVGYCGVMGDYVVMSCWCVWGGGSTLTVTPLCTISADIYEREWLMWKEKVRA